MNSIRNTESTLTPEPSLPCRRIPAIIKCAFSVLSFNRSAFAKVRQLPHCRPVNRTSCAQIPFRLEDSNAPQSCKSNTFFNGSRPRMPLARGARGRPATMNPIRNTEHPQPPAPSLPCRRVPAFLKCAFYVLISNLLASPKVRQHPHRRPVNRTSWAQISPPHECPKEPQSFKSNISFSESLFPNTLANPCGCLVLQPPSPVPLCAHTRVLASCVLSLFSVRSVLNSASPGPPVPVTPGARVRLVFDERIR